MTNNHGIQAGCNGLFYGHPRGKVATSDIQIRISSLLRGESRKYKHAIGYS